MLVPALKRLQVIELTGDNGRVSGIDELHYEVGPCPGDIDGDGEVVFTDLLRVLAAWGPCDPVATRAHDRPSTAPCVAAVDVAQPGDTSARASARGTGRTRSWRR